MTAIAQKLRSLINPAYAAQLGTESYERRVSADEIERLEAEKAELLDALKDTAQTLAWMAFGECRGISKNLLKANESVRKAKEAISSTTGEQL